MSDHVSELPCRIMQIQAVPIAASGNNGVYVELFALCEDGSLWMMFRSNGFANVPCDGLWYKVQGGKDDQQA